jgi:uncharacterized hydrophobic protein (TIGR00341 family)
MKYIEVIADSGNLDTVKAIAEQLESADLRPGPVAEDGTQLTRILVPDDRLQPILDALQGALGMQSSARITVLPVEIALPSPPESEHKEEDQATAARETLFKEARRGARLNQNYLVLVFLSTLVAAIGLVEDNVAVVIGAMVIAPLLGPNIAFALGTALGNTSLMKESAKTLAAGLLLAVAVSFLIGMLWPFEVRSTEILSRTEVGLESVALALASGAAAALSLTTGLSSVLVGVMVSVALLPPAATLGLLLGYGDTELAFGAALLLTINIVCVNLACKVVFSVKRISPRRWLEKEKARRAMTISIVVWIITLAILLAAIYVRQQVQAS